MEQGKHTADAAIASTLFKIDSSGNLDLLIQLALAWSTRLCDAWSHNAITDETLDQPVIFAVTGDSVGDACQAQVEVSTLTDAAMVVLIGNSFGTVIAVDAEGTAEVSEAWNGWLTEVL